MICFPTFFTIHSRTIRVFFFVCSEIVMKVFENKKAAFCGDGKKFNEIIFEIDLSREGIRNNGGS